MLNARLNLQPFMDWGDIGGGAASGAAAGSFGGPVGAIVGAGIGALGGIFGAKETSNATQNAAQIQADAATKAAQLQAQSNAQALAFEEAQAQQSLNTQNATGLGNYNQWAAQQQRLSDFGQMLGLPARNIPAYVPIPGATGTSASASGSVPSGGSNYQPLVSALNSGKYSNPQAAIDAINQQQNLPNGASYAWRSIPNAPGGGVVEVPGGQYLTPNPQGVWGIAGSPASGSSSSTPSNSVAGMNSMMPFMSYTPQNIAGSYTPSNSFASLG